MQVLSRPPSGWPALVLNADFRPLSYYPLSLWPWQDVIKAVFLDRVDVVSTYDQKVHSPSFEIGRRRSPDSTCFCAMPSPASIAAQAKSSPSITLFRDRGAGAQPGKTSSRPVRPAT